MKAIIAFCILILLILALLTASCTVKKSLTKSKILTDSTALHEKIDSIRLLKIVNEKLTAEIHEMQFAGVIFDSSRCPPAVINIPANCNADSVMKILESYKDKVKIYADGTIEAQGKLKSAYYSKDKLSQVISELKKENDSLALVKQKELVKVVTDKQYITKKVKRSFSLIWLLIGAAAGFVLRDPKGILKILS